jgi:hypothetical protein
MQSSQKGGGSSREQRASARYYLHLEVDFQVVGDDESFWGTIKNLSRTGVGISTRQPLRPGQQLTIRFRLHAADGKSVTEELPATVMWVGSSATGLQFHKPLLPLSPIAKKAPRLVARLEEMESSQ